MRITDYAGHGILEQHELLLDHRCVAYAPTGQFGASARQGTSHGEQELEAVSLRRWQCVQRSALAIEHDGLHLLASGTSV
ncbi:hypothetical protein ACFQW6_00770 [Nocardioides sp. GCM10028917]|uniref:hypothetical protein n=1 Tax=Nocardioides sp. GCM10028917 TaxID=3273408 RepID=UPI003605DEB1